MKIGFDVSQTAENKAGCGFLADQLIRALVQEHPDHEYLLYPTFYGYRHPDMRQATRPSGKQVRTLLQEESFKTICQWWDTPGLDRREKLGCPDIIHSNNFSCPHGVDAVRKIMTVYDTSFLDIPEATTEANRLVCFQGMLEASLYADHLVMISQATWERFLHYFPHYPQERTTIIPLGSRPTIQELPETESALLLQKMGVVQGPFWLGVGTVEPRKNYQLLIEAYAQWRETSGQAWPLYIAGGRGWLESAIYQAVEKYSLTDCVKFLGYVSDEELAALYSSCFAFVYPSLYEGFGLPVLEAMTCGAPVIVSNSTSLPEVAGEAGFYINPQQASSLNQQMKALSAQQSLRLKWREASRRQAARFSWSQAAKLTLQAYETALAQEPWFSAARGAGR